MASGGSLGRHGSAGPGAWLQWQGRANARRSLEGVRREKRAGAAGPDLPCGGEGEQRGEGVLLPGAGERGGDGDGAGGIAQADRGGD